MKLLQNITPDEVVEPETKIKGTPIKKLCEYNAGGYQRVIAWLESQQPKEEGNIKTAAELLKTEASTVLTNEMDVMETLSKDAHNVMTERSKKYGDSWKVLTIQSIANLIEMKMNRIANMRNENLDPKIEDEFIDAINYAKMGLYKYKKTKNEV